jgi:hypothetical protein
MKWTSNKRKRNGRSNPRRLLSKKKSKKKPTKRKYNKRVILFPNLQIISVSYLLENDREFLKRIIKGEINEEGDHSRRQQLEQEIGNY